MPYYDASSTSALFIQRFSRVLCEPVLALLVSASGSIESDGFTDNDGAVNCLDACFGFAPRLACVAP